MVTLRPRKAKKEEPKDAPAKKKAAVAKEPKEQKKTDTNNKKDTPQKTDANKKEASKTMSNNKMATMKLATIYPLYVKKVEKKGRTVQELNEVLGWLTSYQEHDLKRLTATDSETTMESFFEGATIHANANMITGKICGHNIEDIEDPLTKKVRYMDKLVDELAKGKRMEEILRSKK